MKTLIRWYRDFPYIHTLRFRLVMLVIAASLPALGLLYYTASQQRSDALDAGQQEASSLANLSAADQGRMVDQTRRYLLTLTRLPELRGDNVYDCMALVKALQEDNASTYANIGIIMADGTIPCQASGVRPIFFQDNPGNLKAALANGDMTISNIAVSPTTPGGIITYVYPVQDFGGETDRVVFVSVPFSTLQSFTVQSNPPPGTIFRMYNRDDILLAQYPGDHDSKIQPYIAATPMPGATVPVEDQTAALLTTSPDIPTLSARAQIELPETVRNYGPVSISVVVPQAEVVSRADSLFQENVGRLLIVAALSIIAAWIGADLFTSVDADSRKRIAHQLYEAYSLGQIDGLDELVSSRFVDHSRNPGQAPGIDGLRQVVVAFKTAFPDGRITVRELIAEHDKVVARVTLVGTHLGDFFGTPPSGKLVASEGDEIFRFEGSLILESWSLFGPLMPVHPDHVSGKHADHSNVHPRKKRPGFWNRLWIRPRRGGGPDAEQVNGKDRQ